MWALLHAPLQGCQTGVNPFGSCCQESDVCHATAMCNVAHQGSCYAHAVQAIDTLVSPMAILGCTCENLGCEFTWLKQQECCIQAFSHACWLLKFPQRTKLSLHSLVIFPFCVHVWQQTLCFHHRVVALGSSCLVKLAMASECMLGASQ